MTTASIGLNGSPVPLPARAGALKPTRVLLPWLTDEEAIAHLLGRPPRQGEGLAAATQSLVLARSAVDVRPAFIPTDPVVTTDRTVLDTIAARPEIAAAFPDVPWRIEMVDLTRIQALQKLIETDRLSAETGPLDFAALVERCFPADQQLPPLAVSPDADGVTISSADPNLQILGHQSYPTFANLPNVPPRPAQAVTFIVASTPSYMQVAHFHGRYFLRDGNHRAASLLRAGVTQAPAIVIDAPSMQYIAPPPLGMFNTQILLSDRPPLVSDFWDTAVAANGLRLDTRKVVRVSAAQYPVPLC